MLLIIGEVVLGNLEEEMFLVPGTLQLVIYH
jgi:hypothetical protein